MLERKELDFPDPGWGRTKTNP